MIKYVFYIISVITVFSALMVIVSKKPMHSVMYMILTMFALAGHYILLNAQFLAVVHIIVYAGAVMVLFLFTIMLLNLNQQEILKRSNVKKIVLVITGGLLLVTMVGAFKGLELQGLTDPSSTQVGMVQNLGKVLFRDFLLPFEMSSVLFLSALVGAIYIGKKD